MHDFVWKIADSPTVSAPSSHWQRSAFADRAEPAQVPRPGHSFGDVGIQQSVAPQLQAKLTVSHPNDSAEKEADNVSDAVMQMPETSPVAARQEKEMAEDMAMPMQLQRKCTQCEKDTADLHKKKPGQPSQKQAVQRVTEKEDKDKMQLMPEGMEEDKDKDLHRMPEEEGKDEDKNLQRMPEGPEEEEESKDTNVQTKSQPAGVPRVTPSLNSEIQSVHSGGAPLSKDSRDFFEPRFGADFSTVRIHTGSQASGVARQLNARAFTVGNHITFGEGHYSPSSSDGKRLMAHELTHVIQQRGRRS